MTPHTSPVDHAHPHSSYYHEDDFVSPRHAHHPRSYEQQQHQFQARLSTASLAQSTDAGGTAVGVGGGSTGVFYSPSSFAESRMATQQYSAAPGPSYTSAAQAGYVEPSMPPPTSATTASNAYYADASNQAQVSAYATAPMASLQHAHTQSHQSSSLLCSSSEISNHITSVSPTMTHLASSPASAPVPPAGVTRTGPGPGPVDPPSPTNLAARRHTLYDIGKWKTFSSGPFAGRTVRAEIKEVQKADLGRKCADPPTGQPTVSSVTAPRGGSGSTTSGGAGVDGDGSGSKRGGKDGDKETSGKDKESEQKAVRKDRRPLDPPPVVELKLYESIHHGTPNQYERQIPSEEIEIGGLICQVDLFRVTIPPSPTEVATLTLSADPMAGIGPAQGHAHGQGQGQQTYSVYGHGHGQGHGVVGPMHTHPHPHHPMQSPYEQHGFAYPPSRRQSSMTAEDEISSMSPLDAGWESASPVSPVSPYTYHPHPAPHHTVLTQTQAHRPHLNAQAPSLHALNSPSPGAPIEPDSLPPPSEADKLTRVLFGESYAHACSILDLSGKPTIYFVFSDLSVKLEGLFRPRYRFFDLFSRTAESSDVPILSQCFGGAFAVYSTKEFPGLKASTPLTKHLSRWGIRVNIRETERKRRAPDGGGGGGGNSSAGGAGGNKDKRKEGNGGGGRRRASRGRSIGTAASSGASVRGEDEVDGDRRGGGDSASSLVTIRRGVDAPRRYLEGAARGRGRTRAPATAGSSSGGELRGRGKRAD